MMDYTIECVKSLRKAEYSCLEIVIIDNCSIDDPSERLRHLFPEADVRRTGENLGYTGGINAGFRAALEKKPDYILVLNPDTEVEKDFLTHLVKAMEENPRAAGACGTIFAFHDRTLVWYAGGSMKPFRGLAVHDHFHEHIERSALGSPKRVTFVTGCMILFRPTALEKAGWEDERFFVILDDIEFSARLQRNGFELLYVPQSIIYHKVLGENESPLKIYYSIRNRLLLIRTSWNGYVRVIASVYFLLVISGKLFVWFFIRRPFFRAGRMGLEDCFQGRFGAGRGTTAFKYREDL
jgi:GT2 family glycosyltransferase